MKVPRVTIVGIHGHGHSHLVAAARAHAEGRIDLVGVADPAGPSDALPEGVPHLDNSGDLFNTVSSDIAVISTPIHTHTDIALAAIAAGNDVLLEKPPTATLDEFHLLRAAADRADRLVQVGFQSLASTAVPHLRTLVRSGVIGEVLRYSASAAWVRPVTYWQRARWAGTRTMDGRTVADGVLTNPLAHATATALAVADSASVDDIGGIELDLYRANDIQSDDTSVAILTLEDGVRLTTAVTLCAPEREEPFIEVVGTTGRLVFYYAIDVVQHFDHATGPHPFTTVHRRIPLLDDLVEARRDGCPLKAPLELTGGFTRLLQAVQDAPEPTPIRQESITMVDDERGRHAVVEGIVPALRAAIAQGRTFRSIGVPWAARG